MRKRFVTSKSTTKQVTYGIYDPKSGEESVREEKVVHVSPSNRRIEDRGGLFSGLRRKKKPSTTDKAEQFAESLKR